MRILPKRKAALKEIIFKFFCESAKAWHGLFSRSGTAIPRALYVSGKLSTYPSHKPTLTLTSHLGKSVGLRRGRWAISQKHIHTQSTFEKIRKVIWKPGFSTPKIGVRSARQSTKDFEEITRVFCWIWSAESAFRQAIKYSYFLLILSWRPGTSYI